MSTPCKDHEADIALFSINIIDSSTYFEECLTQSSPATTILRSQCGLAMYCNPKNVCDRKLWLHCRSNTRINALLNVWSWTKQLDGFPVSRYTVRGMSEHGVRVRACLCTHISAFMGNPRFVKNCTLVPFRMLLLLRSLRSGYPEAVHENLCSGFRR